MSGDMKGWWEGVNQGNLFNKKTLEVTNRSFGAQMISLKEREVKQYYNNKISLIIPVASWNFSLCVVEKDVYFGFNIK